MTWVWLAGNYVADIWNNGTQIMLFLFDFSTQNIYNFRIYTTFSYQKVGMFTEQGPCKRLAIYRT